MAKGRAAPSNGPMSQVRDPVPAFFGGLLMALGGLMCLLSGGCTLVFLVLSGSEVRSTAQLQEMLSISLLSVFVGAIGFVPGFLLWFVGRIVWRGSAPKPLEPLDPLEPLEPPSTENP